MKIRHIWTYFGVPSENDKRRMDVAQLTWGQFHENKQMPIASPRPTNDPHRAPYVIDLIREGWQDAPRNMILLLSNADLGFETGSEILIREAVEEHGSCWTQRHDFEHTPIESIYTVKDGALYPGPEAFAFDYRWFRECFTDYPDFIFARQHWDCGLRLLMRKTGGVLVPDIAWHETHAPQWLDGSCNRSNLYNERLLCEWIAKNGGSTQDHLYTNEELGFR